MFTTFLFSFWSLQLVWNFSPACWLLWGSLWLLHILFLCTCTTWHTDLSMTVHLLNEVCFCLGTSISRVQHGQCGHLRQVSPDCSCHPSPQMCFHPYPGLYFDPFWLQCAGEPSADLPWPGQRSKEVCCLSDSGKWMLLWGDQCDSLSFQAPIILHCDTQLHKIHSPINQTTCSLPASLLLSAAWLSCLFVSVNNVGMVSAAQLRLLLLSWTKYMSLMRQMCLSLARPTLWNDDVHFLTVCETD